MDAEQKKDILERTPDPVYNSPYACVEDWLGELRVEWNGLQEKVQKLEAIKKLKDELDEQIDFIDRASRTHGLLETEKPKHELRKLMSKRIGKILEAGADG